MRRRRRPKRPENLKAQLLASVCVGLLLGALVIHACNTRLRPAIIAIAADHLSNQISGQICDVINAELEEENITYNSICTVQRDASGAIVALQTDMARLNLLKSTITTDVAREFDNGLIPERIEIPLGNLLPFFSVSGHGPGVTVVVLSVGNISAEFENVFASAGINQTLHRVVLTVTAELSLLLPGGVYTYTDETRMVLAETVLLGQVPDSYTYFSQFDSAQDAYDAHRRYGSD